MLKTRQCGAVGRIATTLTCPRATVFPRRAYYSRNNEATRTFLNGRLKQFGAVVFYGIEEETQLAAETYEELATTIFTMAMAKYGSAYRGNGGIYAEGFVEGLERQLSNANREAESSGTELVVRSAAIVQAKKNRAEHWLRDECRINLMRGSLYAQSSGILSFSFSLRNLAVIAPFVHALPR